MSMCVHACARVFVCDRDGEGETCAQLDEWNDSYFFKSRKLKKINKSLNHSVAAGDDTVAARHRMVYVWETL